MTAAELTLERTPEAERVLAWRLEELERAGYGRLDARKIAARNDIDLHLAVSLVRGGCSVETALAILL